MSKTIKLSLSKALIIESVKNDTFRKGEHDKTSNPALFTAAYHEQAGDEAYHTRTLERAFYSSLEELKTLFSDYVFDDGSTTGSNVVSSYEEDEIEIIELNVGDRFSGGFAEPLARMAATYIENSMLVLWWTPISREQATFYTQLVERNTLAIKRCFNKKAPTVPKVPFPNKITLTGNAIHMVMGEEATVTYTIPEGTIDDVEAIPTDTKIISTSRDREGFIVKALNVGVCTLKILSKHDEDVVSELTVTVVEE